MAWANQTGTVPPYPGCLLCRQSLSLRFCILVCLFSFLTFPFIPFLLLPIPLLPFLVWHNSFFLLFICSSDSSSQPLLFLHITLLLWEADTRCNRDLPSPAKPFLMQSRRQTEQKPRELSSHGLSDTCRGNSRWNQMSHLPEVSDRPSVHTVWTQLLPSLHHSVLRDMGRGGLWPCVLPQLQSPHPERDSPAQLAASKYSRQN